LYPRSALNQSAFLFSGEAMGEEALRQTSEYGRRHEEAPKSVRTARALVDATVTWANRKFPASARRERKPS